MPFAIACTLLEDVVTAQAVSENEHGLFNPARLALSAKVVSHEVKRYSDLFPAERWAHARIVLNDGRELVSDPTEARGSPDNPLRLDELVDKYNALASSGLAPEVVDLIREQCLGLERLSPVALGEFQKLLATPVQA